MKKILLIVLVFGIGYSSFAQEFVKKSTKAPQAELQLEPAPSHGSTALDGDTPTAKTEMRNGRAVTYVPIGTSGNAYGFYSNSRTYLWADPNLNSVVFTHRMAGGVEVEGNSRVGYDISTDGGTTWNNNNVVYTPTAPGPQYPEAAARYPQGVIMNPEGNTDPSMAHYSYLAASVVNTNGIWGAYVYGSNPLTTIDPTTPTQTLIESGDGMRLIPDAFTATNDGISWYVEPSTDYTSGASEYTGELIVGRGEIVDGEVLFEEELVEFLEPLDSFNDSKISFAPDGQTGYMVFMSDVVSDPTPYTSYHPVLLKTIDGGESWSDPIDVQFGGVDGIESIKYYWSDEILEAIDVYGPGFNRDEVYYNMGFSVNIVVDGQGNPHLTGIIAIGNEDGWYPGEGTMATFHVYSPDGGTTWDATALYDNLFFDGEVGGLGNWNRPYAASTVDGHYLVFSWIDTDLDGAEANTNPNIFVVGYDSEDHVYTDVDNVTELSTYWFSAFYGSMSSRYVFAEEGADAYSLEIPLVFTEYTNPGVPEEEMNFYYIDDYVIGFLEGVDSHEGLADFSVGQNSPNPAINTTSILVTSESTGIIELTVNNILGQVVNRQVVENNSLGYTFNVDVSGLDAGIYFYTVEIGKSSVTKKMIVK